MRNDRGHKFTAQCPAHDDHKPSLDVATGQDGKALLICRSGGCDTTQILAALDLHPRDLFPPTNGRHSDMRAPDPGQPRTLEATYLYTVDGEPLIRKHRYRLADGTKTFTIQHRTNTSSTWKNGQAGLTPDPYRWTDWADSPPHRAIFIVEGEKDADRLTTLGLQATTHISGAPTGDTPKWPNNWGQTYFAGRNLIILPDNDPPGQRHAQHAATNTHPHAATVRIINLPDLPPKGDITDWLDLEHTLDDLHHLADTTPLWTPPQQPASRYRLLTVQQLLDLPEPEWLIDSILPHGTVGMIVGPPGSGKSYLALEIACTLADNTRNRWGGHATQTGHVVYITGEGQWGLGQRIEAWRHGHDGHHLNDRLRFVTAIPAANNADDIEELCNEIDKVTTQPHLIVFDTLARLALGLDENSASDMGTLVNVSEALRDRYQTTVALIHHTTKDGKMYRGSSALLGAVSWQWTVALNNVADPNYIRVTCERQKDGRPFDPLTLTFTEWDETGYLTLSQRAAWNEREVAIVHALIDDPITHRQPDCDSPHPWFIAAPIRPSNIPPRAWQRGLKALVTQGILEQRGTTRNTEHRWSDFACITFPKLQDVAMSQSVSQSRSNDCDTPPSLKEGGWRRKDADADAEPEGGTIL